MRSASAPPARARFCWEAREQRPEQPADRPAAEYVAETRSRRTGRAAERDARIEIRRRDADPRRISCKAALGSANVGTALQERRPITDRDGIGDLEADVAIARDGGQRGRCTPSESRGESAASVRVLDG